MADDTSGWGSDTPGHTWTDADRPQLIPETIPNVPPMTTQAPQPDTGGGVSRDLAVGSTRAAGTPFDLISDIKEPVLDPIVNFLHNRIGLPTGPEIPIPTTEAQRSWYGVAPPQDREERIADAVGQGIGTGVSALALPGVGGGAALSAGTGATASALSQEYFPDSLAMQMIASGVGGFGSALVARRLLFGALPSAAAAPSMVNTLTHEYVGRLIGAGVGALGGGEASHSVIGAELGGIAGLIGGRWAAPAMRYLFSPTGMRSLIAGSLGGMPGEIGAANQRQNWGNSLGPIYTGAGLQ